MSFNPFTIKKYATLLLAPLLTVVMFFTGLQLYNLVYGLGFMAGGLLVSVIIGVVLLKNPFSDMLEGKGILCLNIDSTGIIRPFVVSVQSPYIKNEKMGVDDVFDREAVHQLAVPKNARVPLMKNTDGDGVRIVMEKSSMVRFKEIFSKKKGETLELSPENAEKVKETTKKNLSILEINEEEYNSGRFALFHYPCLLYNEQTRTIITKDFLADQEKEAFAEHSVLYLNRKMEELTSVVRDFGRYVVELTKPQGGLLQSKWVWILIIGAIILMAVLFAPAVIQAVAPLFEGAGEALGTASSNAGGAVTPR